MPNILVADDQASIRKLIRTYLERSGYRVCPCGLLSAYHPLYHCILHGDRRFLRIVPGQ